MIFLHKGHLAIFSYPFIILHFAISQFPSFRDQFFFSKKEGFRAQLLRRFLTSTWLQKRIEKESDL